MKKILTLSFLLIGAISMVAMSYHYFQFDTSGILRTKPIAVELWYFFTFRTHIFCGLIAICIAPAQFLNRLRSQYPGVHKISGYVYVVSVALSGISSLLIAQYAMGGIISMLGFSLLSILWLVTTSKAVIAARSQDLLIHRKWMVYSFALTFAAITQRTLLLIPLLTDVPFLPVYQLSAWLPWLLNLMIAYRINRSTAVTKHRLST